ncbi:MAG: hypothetical protein P8Y47_09665 [Alphaproteobacteria bacterium]
MGILSDEDGGDYLESVVYFLSDALRATIEIGDALQQAASDVPQVTTGMNCTEIADMLAAFRKRTDDLWGQEVLMVSKIMRARELVVELREMEPELRPEIDTFRLATVSIPDLQSALLPNAQKHFNGGRQPKRFLEELGRRLPGHDGGSDPVIGYKIAGHTDVRMLLVACETLHYGLAARYGFDSIPVREFDEAAEQARLEREQAVPPILSNFANMLNEVNALQQQQHQRKKPALAERVLN